MGYSVINILNNETITSAPLGILITIPKDSCAYTMKIPYEKRCEFVYETHDCAIYSAPLVNPFQWVFCDFSEEWSFIGVFAMFFTLMLLFFLTSILADVFICPNLEVVSETLKLPESLAGVTILAFGNGAPDLFAAYAGAEMEHPEIMFASITGSGLFVTSFVSGMIMFTRPFRVDKWSLFRNVTFYLITYSILFTSFYFRHYTIFHALCILGMYVLYLTINLLDVIANHFLKKKKLRKKTDDEQWLKVMARERSLFLPNPEERTSFAEGVIMRNEARQIYSRLGFELALPQYRSGTIGYNWKHFKPLFNEFIEELSFSKYIGPKASRIRKIIMYIQIPLIIILKLAVPAVHKGERNDGWCKLLVMINVFLLPNLLWYGFDYEEYMFANNQLRLDLWLITTLSGLAMSTAIFFTTESYAKPSFHWVMAYLGFIGAIAIIRFVSAQVIFHLNAIGARYTISGSILAITLLSWGNCLVDCVSNTAISMHGMQNMGFAACYGGPMFNCSLGVGLISIIVHLRGTPIEAFYGHISPVGSLFIFISLLSILIFIPCMDFEARRCFGIYLMLLYATFFILCCLMEETIHAFGTQYFKDYETAVKHK